MLIDDLGQKDYICSMGDGLQTQHLPSAVKQLEGLEEAFSGQVGDGFGEMKGT